MVSITSVPTGQFILFCWAVFLVFWFIESFFAKKTVEKRGRVMGMGILIRLLIGLVIILVVGEHFSLLSLQLWPYSTLSGVIADIIAGCGLALLLWARVVLGGNWSASVVLKADHELIQRGPYAVVRHPIYSGLLLMFLGEAVWYGSMLWLIVFIAVCIAMYAKARMEESFLTQHFPSAYPAYKARTKALIPFVF